MRFERFGHRLQVRLESGDAVMESLLRLMNAERIEYAAVTGLGAVRQVRLSYWNAETREYETHEIEEQLEVVSLVGNVTLNDHRPFLHLHISLGRRDLSVFGGHFNDAVAHPTLEVWVQPEDRPVHRARDEASGLALMQLSEELLADHGWAPAGATALLASAGEAIRLGRNALREGSARAGRMSDALLVERDGPGGAVVRVTLTRPEVHNAFNAPLIGQLRATFRRLAEEPPDKLRAVVLAGQGASFCAGADVTWMRASLGLSREENEQDAMVMAEMFDAIDRCPVPVVSRVHGAALGGGMGLCAVSDLVIAEAGARFGFTETRLGILPAVISPFVISKIGESHARALFPPGRRFDATRALRIGLVHEVVEGERALDEAVDVAIADVLDAGPTAARAAKAIVREVRGLPHESTRWHTARRIAAQRSSAEGQEGLRAFLEKSRPAWCAPEGGD